MTKTTHTTQKTLRESLSTARLNLHPDQETPHEHPRFHACTHRPVGRLHLPHRVEPSPGSEGWCVMPALLTCECCGVAKASVRGGRLDQHSPDTCAVCWEKWLDGRTVDAAAAFEQNEHCKPCDGRGCDGCDGYGFTRFGTASS